jgi:hypothetical protein
LPADRRERPAWRHVAKQLDGATRGADTIDVMVPLMMVLSMEGVECQPQ